MALTATATSGTKITEEYRQRKTDRIPTSVPAVGSTGRAGGHPDTTAPWRVNFAANSAMPTRDVCLFGHYLVTIMAPDAIG